MENLQSFLAYAGDFEKTLHDDDWARLRQYFAADAVYEVVAEAWGCRLVGPTAIFAGMKKSLDGFDRKFPRRDIKIDDGPHFDGDEIKLAWTVTYLHDSWTPFVLVGSSTIRYRDGKIAHLADTYDDRTLVEVANWQRINGATLDPSYV